ncbi:ATP-dependent zinc metalloprotease FtsH, partial [Bdellovibrionota bacterium FG-1]
MAPPARKVRWNIFFVLAAVWLALGVRDVIVYNKQVESIPYSQFLKFLDEHNLDQVMIGSGRVEGVLKTPPAGHPNRFVAVKVDDPGLIQRLAAAQVRFEGLRESSFLKDVLTWTLPLLLMLGFWWFVMGRMGRAQGQLFSLGKAKAKVFVERDLKIRFGDVAGVDEAKEELLELVNFLKAPVPYGRLGGRMPKGMLLVGPPGTGKTLLARAVAGEAGVPFFSINGSEFVEMFVGLGAARVRDLFEQARSQAPCIIFIDELDALGKARGIQAISGGNDEKEQTLNQLLAELDGFDPSQGVVLLAATNRPEVLDPALLRSGRFDRQIMIEKPDRKGREQILSLHLKKVQFAPNVDSGAIAALTAGFSGADLANLANEAALIATRRGAIQVEKRDFTEGIERIVGGLEHKSRILSPQEKERVAFHEMGHAAVSFVLERGQTIHKVSIISRGIGALGYTMSRPTEDRYLINRDELENKLVVLLGGRAAETVFFSEISTGAADDLDKATEIARAMVTRYGMGQSLGLLTFDRETAPMLGGQLLARSHDY